ncbi:unnamed protein product [Amoebophrya sp. A25]|nr:unnamed protein product [Amoebophrya sp. A25]|eukprot:GSA25T00024029001.1
MVTPHSRPTASLSPGSELCLVLSALFLCIMTIHLLWLSRLVMRCLVEHMKECRLILCRLDDQTGDIKSCLDDPVEYRKIVNGM